MSLMDLAGRTVVDDMHSESSSAVDIDGGDADMRSSAAEQRQQEEQQQRDATNSRRNSRKRDRRRRCSRGNGEDTNVETCAL